MIQKGCHKIRAHSGAPKLADSENIFSKSVFKRGVKSTRNDLICPDPKSCRINFFQKTQKILGSIPQKIDQEIFSKKVLQKGGQIDWK